MLKLPRVLIIAGSDSGGGAGIQADIKTVSLLGGYAATSITAVTAQNTTGVYGIHALPPAFVAQQTELVLTDIGADVIKTGMLFSAEIIHALADTLNTHARDIPRVIDPVMVAKGGSPLLKPEAVDALKTRLINGAMLVTPNLPEAALLAGQAIESTDDMKKAAEAIAALGAKHVLIKGGHVEGDALMDILLTDSKIIEFSSPRIASTSTHGTGCTLASAIATYLGHGIGMKEAVALARAYVTEAIRTAPGLGSGHGPLNHLHPLAEVFVAKRANMG